MRPIRSPIEPEPAGWIWSVIRIHDFGNHINKFNHFIKTYLGTDFLIMFIAPWGRFTVRRGVAECVAVLTKKGQKGNLVVDFFNLIVR